MRRVCSRTVLVAEPPLGASAPVAEYSSTNAVPPNCLATPRASRRAMRRTDFCLLTSSYQHPRLVGSRFGRDAFAPLDRRDRLPHVSAIRFGGLHVSFCCRREGLLVPIVTCANRPSGISVASSVSRRPLARCAHPRKPPRPFSARPRERLELLGTIRDTFRLTRTFAPQRPLGRPAWDFPGFTAWPPRFQLSTPFHLAANPFGCADRLGPRPRAPLPAGINASLSLGVTRRLLQPCYDARAHPSSRRSSRASGAFAPLLAGTNRCRLRWSSQCVATSENLRATTCM